MNRSDAGRIVRKCQLQYGSRYSAAIMLDQHLLLENPQEPWVASIVERKTGRELRFQSMGAYDDWTHVVTGQMQIGQEKDFKALVPPQVDPDASTLVTPQQRERALMRTLNRGSSGPRIEKVPVNRKGKR